MIPGPTEVSPQVLEKLSLPIKTHSGDQWAEYYFQVVSKVKKVFQTKNSLFILPSTSSGAMEMSISHAVEPGQKVLICKNGFFGERFEEIAVCLGAEVVTTESDYGQPITNNQVARTLEKHPDIRALAVVHNETSTGVENGLSGITAIAREKGVLTIVDTVSSMGAVDIPVDRLGIDFCVTGTQKALGAPCGLAFLSVSQGAWEVIKARKQPVCGWYMNLNILKKYQEMWQAWHPQGPQSASVSLYRAFSQALDEIFQEGLETRFARHKRSSYAVRKAIHTMGLNLLAKDSSSSKTLTTVCLPDGIDQVQLLKALEHNHGILVAGGLGPTAKSLIRIGHMSRTASPEYLVPTIEALETELLNLGTEIEKGSGARSFEESWAAFGETSVP